MIATKSEVEDDLDRFLDMVSGQDIFILENGKVIARLTSNSGESLGDRLGMDDLED